MFSLAVIIPATIVFFLTYRNAAVLASASEATGLRLSNKSYAMAVFQRLEIARSTLEQMPLEVQQAGTQAPWAPIFTEVLDLGTPLKQASESYAPSTGTLEIRRDGNAKPAISLIARNRHASQPRLVRGTLDPGFLWADPQEAIPDGRICVRSGTVELTCGGTAAPSPRSGMLQDRWALVLKPEFGVPAWHFIAERPRHGSFESYAGFLLPLAAGMLLLALLLSSIEIRRILVPLEALLGRIEAMGGARTTRVGKHEDEFATLGRTFQSMESRIGRQIRMLETLQQIDRLILARVPLREVVELVVARVRAIVGARPIAISLFSTADEVSERHFFCNPEGPLVMCFDGGAGPVDDCAAARPRAHGWQQAANPGPGLEALRLATVWSLTVGQDKGPWVRLSLGQLPNETGQAQPGAGDAHGELEELAGRVTVALAAEAHEKRLVHQARHDLLTNLPNRLAVFEALPGIIRQAGQSGHGFATLFVDLDRFKAINDGLGHVVGDTVLAEVARRIRKAVGPESLVARLGGDEFFVVAPGAGDREAALAIDAAMRHALESPILLESTALFIDFTAGVALYPDHGSDSEQLMQNADLAMYRAKRLGGGSAMLFAAGMNEIAARRVQMENDLRIAVGGNQLHLYYQPRVDSRQGSIVGAEALLRWNHPLAGNIPPDDFIGLAEECGLIRSIGAYVIDSACRQMAQWRSAGLDLPLIAVNVSPHQLRAGDLFETIADALSTHGLEWRHFEIEITESALVEDPVFAGEQLARLREAGCTVAIDDFGTGYSSLAYLSNLPTDTIKIDRSFIRELHSPATQAVVRSIIALGKGLDKTIIAEGVEKHADVALLNSWGCHIVQGYVYFPPLAPECMSGLLAGNTRNA